MSTRTVRPASGTKGLMSSRRFVTVLAAVAGIVSASACGRGFQLRKYPATDALFAASLAELGKKKWDNAISGFEKLTLDLSARDTILPLAHWYLAQAHEGKKEFILAATSYSRLAEAFPDDSLGDDALFASGRAYLRLWRSPTLDPQYGTLAQVQFRQLLNVYPESPLKAETEKALLSIDEQFAAKDYLTGVFYVRRNAFDSSIIMFKDVVKNYPNTDHARMALLRMVEVYRQPRMNYKEEAAETCGTLRTAYSGDPEVARICPVAVVADSAAKPVKPPVDTTTASATRSR